MNNNIIATLLLINQDRFNHYLSSKDYPNLISHGLASFIIVCCTLYVGVHVFLYLKTFSHWLNAIVLSIIVTSIYFYLNIKMVTAIANTKSDYAVRIFFIIFISVISVISLKNSMEEELKKITQSEIENTYRVTKIIASLSDTEIEALKIKKQKVRNVIDNQVKHAIQQQNDGPVGVTYPLYTLQGDDVVQIGQGVVRGKTCLKDCETLKNFEGQLENKVLELSQRISAAEQENQRVERQNADIRNEIVNQYSSNTSSWKMFFTKLNPVDLFVGIVIYLVAEIFLMYLFSSKDKDPLNTVDTRSRENNLAKTLASQAGATEKVRFS